MSKRFPTKWLLGFLLVNCLLNCASCRHFSLALDGQLAPPNLRLPTLGGKQLWSDKVVVPGGRIQQHVWTGHFRLLDFADTRHAWGSLAHCQSVLTSWAPALRAFPSTENRLQRPIVVLLHGLIRSKDSLWAIEKEFSQKGYMVVNINYASSRQSLTETTDGVESVLNGIGGQRKLIFITHSYGGLVVRELLSRKSSAWRKRHSPHRVCMLFPPNQGSMLAERVQRFWLYKFVLGQAGESILPKIAQALPVPDCPVGVIAGGVGNGMGRNMFISGDDDGTVAVSETHLEGEALHKTLPVGHTFGMNKTIVIEEILRFVLSD